MWCVERNGYINQWWYLYQQELETVVSTVTLALGRQKCADGWRDRTLRGRELLEKQLLASESMDSHRETQASYLYGSPLHKEPLFPMLLQTPSSKPERYTVRKSSHAQTCHPTQPRLMHSMQAILQQLPMMPTHNTLQNMKPRSTTRYF